ncbi:MAG: STAS domain-containing protein [Planctomycetota bacterium]|nr:STAS domain-containing protein [Planctomycetota bacterium]
MEQKSRDLLRAGGDLTCRFADDIAVVRLKGRLDLALSNTFLEFLRDDLSQEPQKLVLNFDQLQYLSSAGVSLLIRLSSEHQLKIVGPRQEILGTLETVGIRSLLEFYPTEKAAVHAFVSHPSE